MCISKIINFFKSEEQQAFDDSYKEKCIELARIKGVKDANTKYGIKEEEK